MVDVMSSDSINTVGDIVSSLDDPGLCFRSSAQAHPLKPPSRFSFMNISNSRSSSLSI